MRSLIKSGSFGSGKSIKDVLKEEERYVIPSRKRLSWPNNLGIKTIFNFRFSSFFTFFVIYDFSEMEIGKMGMCSSSSTFIIHKREREKRSCNQFLLCLFNIGESLLSLWSHSFQKSIQNLVKHLKWSFLRK